jgi:hypothetical protein
VISGDKSRSDDEFTYTGRFKTLAGGGKPRSSTAITRLDKELIWRIDDQKKQYTELTFAEMREMMAKGKAEMETQAAQADAQKPQDVDFDFKVDVNRTGKKETVNGFAAEQVIVTLTGASKDKTSGAQGSMTMTMDQWLSDDVPGTAEVRTYYKEFAEKMGIDPELQRMGAAAMAMYGNAIRKMADALKDLHGYPVRSTMTIETGAVLTPEQQAELEKAKTEQAQAQAEAKQQRAAAEKAEDAEASASAVSDLKKGKIAGALGGMFGRKANKAASKKAEEKADAMMASGSSAPGPAFTATTEVLSVTTGSAGVSYDVPAGYKKIERSKP